MGRHLRTKLQHLEATPHHPGPSQTKPFPPPYSVHSRINERRQLRTRSRKRQHPTTNILYKPHPPRPRNTIPNGGKGSPRNHNSSTSSATILPVTHDHHQNGPSHAKNPAKTRFSRLVILLGHRIVRIYYSIRAARTHPSAVPSRLSQRPSRASPP